MKKYYVKLFLYFIIGLLTAFLAMHFVTNFLRENKNTDHTKTENHSQSVSSKPIPIPLTK